jgi:RNA polymerase sigma-54 factor
MNDFSPQMNLSQDQKLVMTPQLQLAIKLLAMPTIDLHDFVAGEITENPFLNGEEDSYTESSSNDEGPTDAAEALASNEMGGDETLATDFSWDDMYDGDSLPGSSQSTMALTEATWENLAHKTETLHDVLMQQLGAVLSDPKERFIGRYLIDAIDDSGYLRVDVKRVAEQLKVSQKQVEAVLEVVQTFDPAGVAARDLAECLRLQLEDADQLTPAMDAILNNLEMLARQDMAGLAKVAGVAEEEIAPLLQDIQNLNPKPGLKYGGGEASSVTPDVIVTRGDGGWRVELNSASLPKVLVSGEAQKYLTGSSETKKYVNERLNRAQWLIKALAQRAQTIYKVASHIIEVQGGFFDYGVEGLTPLTLKQVAEKAEVHESTVSRVTTGKYMATPMGTFELKYFFSSGVSSTGGQVGVASVAVKDLIKKLISEENPAKPISDEALAERLKDEGVAIARRTVAKYRESLGIASSSGRRIKG